MIYYKVSKKDFTPSQFAISENIVFVFNRELGGAFEHNKKPAEVFELLLDLVAEGFTVEKIDGKTFSRSHNWFCVDDFKIFVNLLEVE